MSLFPWALFRSTKSAVKIHTLLDLRGAIPAFIYLPDGKTNDTIKSRVTRLENYIDVNRKHGSINDISCTPRR